MVDLARVGADFHGDPAGRDAGKLTLECCSNGRQTGLFDQFSLRIKNGHK
jgi:hypothetical protein